MLKSSQTSIQTSMECIFSPYIPHTNLGLYLDTTHKSYYVFNSTAASFFSFALPLFCSFPLSLFTARLLCFFILFSRGGLK